MRSRGEGGGGEPVQVRLGCPSKPPHMRWQARLGTIPTWKWDTRAGAGNLEVEPHTVRLGFSDEVPHRWARRGGEPSTPYGGEPRRSRWSLVPFNGTRAGSPVSTRRSRNVTITAQSRLASRWSPAQEPVSDPARQAGTTSLVQRSRWQPRTPRGGYVPDLPRQPR